MVDVDVWNMALGLVRARAVAVTTEASPSAEACRLYYENCQRQVLAAVPWTFATTWRKLHKHLVETAPAGLHALSLPQGVVKVWGARTPDYPQLSDVSDAGIEYEIKQGASGTRIVQANRTDAEFQLTMMTDVGLWPAAALEAVSFLLASKIAIPLAGVEQGRFLRKEYAQEFLFSMDRAQSEDAGPSRLTPQESKYIAGRR